MSPTHLSVVTNMHHCCSPRIVWYLLLAAAFYWQVQLILQIDKKHLSSQLSFVLIQYIIAAPPAVHQKKCQNLYFNSVGCLLDLLFFSFLWSRSYHAGSVVSNTVQEYNKRVANVMGLWQFHYTLGIKVGFIQFCLGSFLLEILIIKIKILNH